MYWGKDTDVKVVPDIEDTVFSFWRNGRESEFDSGCLAGRLTGGRYHEPRWAAREDLWEKKVWRHF